MDLYFIWFHFNYDCCCNIPCDVISIVPSFCPTQICFFAGGWIFFVKQLFRNYEVRHISVQLIFSTTFALSLTMFELIIFEIIGLLESSSRYFHWRLELTLLLFMVIALIPFYIAYSSICNIRFGG